jgi:threonine dehydratase/serine racemase
MTAEARYAVDLAAIRRAAERIAPHAHRTPLVTSRTMDALAGCALLFKCEHLQRVGAFKFRGACSAVFALDDHAARRGVVTHSSGNHAQALALAAKLRGIAAHVVMPTNAPRPKREAVIGYGARVIDCAPTLAAREETAARVVAETGAALIPPYDHPDVIAGQGTIALELFEQAPDLDAIVAPIGGGGLISGLALAARELSPRVKVIGAEPAGADDAARSKAARTWLPQTAPATIADGLRTSLGALTWPVVRDVVDRVITVDDDAIRGAMRLVFERMKFVIEPSAAVPVAAVLSGALRGEPALRKVAIVLSGGNVELPWDHIAR